LQKSKLLGFLASALEPVPVQVPALLALLALLSLLSLLVARLVRVAVPVQVPVLVSHRQPSS
jgi:hypothetical protein